MEDKILWMVGEAAKDGMKLCEDDVYLILASPGASIYYSAAEIDYVEELDREWSTD